MNSLLKPPMLIPDKQQMTEQDICTKFVVPTLEAAGWNIMTQVREQYFFTDGRIMAKGKTVIRGDRKHADFLLNYKANIPLAIIEAKDNNHAFGAGMQQGLAYAETLDIRNPRLARRQEAIQAKRDSKSLAVDANGRLHPNRPRSTHHGFKEQKA